MCESLIFSYLPHFLPFFKTLVSIYHFNSYKKDCEIFFSLNKALGQGPCSLISISVYKVLGGLGRERVQVVKLIACCNYLSNKIKL